MYMIFQDCSVNATVNEMAAKDREECLARINLFDNFLQEYKLRILIGSIALFALVCLVIIVVICKKGKIVVHESLLKQYH